MALSEGICREYSKPFGRCFKRSRNALYCVWIVGFLTNSQVAVVLIESHEVHFHVDRWERGDGNQKKKKKRKGDENRLAERVLSRTIEPFTVCLNSLQAISSPRSRTETIDSDDYGDSDDDNKGGASTRYPVALLLVKEYRCVAYPGSPDEKQRVQSSSIETYKQVVESEYNERDVCRRRVRGIAEPQFFRPSSGVY